MPGSVEVPGSAEAPGSATTRPDGQPEKALFDHQRVADTVAGEF
ncbi:hypothetical protein [Haloprofundus salinisoli]|nr:hypothetical protein [Haloprofundus salinisoli]